jgi:putative tricarboxylic transport membrane protein
LKIIKRNRRISAVYKFNNDQICAIVWLVIGVSIVIASVQYSLGTLDAPGIGFLPFLSGLAISFFSLIGTIVSTIDKRQGIGWKPLWKNVDLGKSLIAIAALLAYVFLLNSLGFFMCTTLFIGFLLRAIKPQRWVVVIVGAILTAVGTYVIFEIWLKAQLPKGPFGF